MSQLGSQARRAPGVVVVAVIAVAVAAASSPSLARAEPYAPRIPRRNTLGLDVALVLPLGDYAELVTAGAGPLLRLELPFKTGDLTVRGGVILHATDEDVGSLTLVPIYIGYRYPLGGAVYAAAELGVTLAYASVDTGFGSRISSSDEELGLTLGAGARLGKLDLRAALFFPDTDDLIGIMGSAGFTFAAF